MSTPHNSANKGDIAKIVLMPGDPLRAQYIAENFLENPVCFNRVRGMLGFTGTYKGKTVSVMGHGMGNASIGIYSYELYHHYDVDCIMRVGSAGALHDDLKLKDIILAQGACTDSNYAEQYDLPGTYCPIADFDMLRTAADTADELGIKYMVGNVSASDHFYSMYERGADKWKAMGVLGLEMESAALYMNAAEAHKRALTILSISDHIYTGEQLSPEERQVGFNNMIKLALETAIKLI
ncbi:MAG: purine-nucleoside phosphorylase [Clostridia bacterium]|nr:purine-nucleoside phosphorylase [Clostridia bacterium]